MKAKKRILITGISKGIGKAIALELSKNGHIVYGTSRDPGNLKDKIKGVEYIPLDLADENSILGCYETLKDIDILINNAGQSQMGPAEELEGDKVREVFETNFFGTISLTKKYLKTMRENKKGLVINVSSLSGRFSIPFQSSYAASKVALNTWTLCLRKEIKYFGVDVCLLELYFINSGIKLDYVCDDNSVYKTLVDRVHEKRKGKLKKASVPSVVVKTVNKIIESKAPKSIYISGGMGSFYSFISRLLSPAQIEKLSSRVAGLKKD